MDVHKQIRAEYDGRRLYGTLDASKVNPYEQHHEEDEGWRDPKTGPWFETDVPPPDAPEGDWNIRAKKITCYCNLVEAKTFGNLLWATTVFSTPSGAQTLAIRPVVPADLARISCLPVIPFCMGALSSFWVAHCDRHSIRADERVM